MSALPVARCHAGIREGYGKGGSRHADSGERRRVSGTRKIGVRSTVIDR